MDTNSGNVPSGGGAPVTGRKIGADGPLRMVRSGGPDPLSWACSEVVLQLLSASSLGATPCR